MAKCPYRFQLSEKKQECIKHDCEFFIHLFGMNPQTGQPQDTWVCSIAALPILLVENTSMTRQGAASTDKVANQIHKQRAEFIAILPEKEKQMLLESNPELLPSPNGKQ